MELLLRILKIRIRKIAHCRKRCPTKYFCGAKKVYLIITLLTGFESKKMTFLLKLSNFSSYAFFPRGYPKIIDYTLSQRERKTQSFWRVRVFGLNVVVGNGIAAENPENKNEKNCTL